VGGDIERQGDHLCLTYEDGAGRIAALVPFFERGLAQGERCICVDGATSRRVEQALRAAGVQVGNELERGALVLLTGLERLWRGGEFAPGNLIDLLRQAEQEALDDGFSGLRVALEMTWALFEERGSHALLEHETQLNRFLPGSRTLVICQYDRRRFPDRLLRDVLPTHPLVVLGDELCPNVYYEPPGAGAGSPSPADRLDRAFAQLRRAGASERRLADLKVQLAEQGGDRERADRAKEDFLAMLAHELRNPLGTISNALQVLRLNESRDETWRRAIDAAERQVSHQAHLVDDLLEASAVTQGRIELHREQVGLAELVRSVVREQHPALADAGLRLDCSDLDERLAVYGDRRRLAQALAELLRNAIHFTAPEGEISVRVAAAADGRAEVSVRDSGSGIGAEMLPHVFEVFTQADQGLDRGRGGLGVGLAVTKRLVELHGGEVTATSDGPGLGSEFTLLLPLDLETSGTVERAAGARRILVVEDNPDAAATLRDFLELSGHEVELAFTGSGGVAAARQFHPEVVLCDIGLPGMDGFEVAAELRRDPQTASAQLIAVTGYGRDEDRRLSKAAGFDLHLTKPVDPAQLRQALELQGTRH